jgi:phospholipid/cholesterol/gamma-HCH transport system permease protein
MVLPFIYTIAIAVGVTASYLSVVVQLGQVSSGGYLQLFWMFQTPLDFVFSMIKGMVMATFVVLVGIYYGYHVTGGPVGVGRATAKSLGTQLFWGSNPRSPIGG